LERVLACLREVEALAERLDDPRRLGRVADQLSNHYRRMGAYDQARVAAQRALALATASGAIVLQALAHVRLGQVYQMQGDNRRAIVCLEQTVMSFDEARRRERLGQAAMPVVQPYDFVQPYALLAWCHGEQGTFAEGRALGDAGLQIAEALAHPMSLMMTAFGVGRLALRQGDLRSAIPRLERALSLSQEADNPAMFPLVAATLGTAYSLDGRVADAVSLLTQAMEQGTATERVDFQALCCLALGEAYVLAGRLEEAHALAARTLGLVRARQERGNEAYALRLLGAIAAHREPPEMAQAETHYRQALALAVELYTATEMTFWLPETEATLAQVEGR
jgi:tetratricopeptide (TPR) repeat protein